MRFKDHPFYVVFDYDSKKSDADVQAGRPLRRRSDLQWWAMKVESPTPTRHPHGFPPACQRMESPKDCVVFRRQRRF